MRLSSIPLCGAALFIAGMSHTQPLVSASHSTGVTERNVLVLGEHIHYLEAGSGPTIILVHGLGDDARIWMPEIGPLARRFHVIALDQIGFGRSDKPLLDYRPQTFVDFLDQFIATLHLGQVIIVGHSFGGWVAALLAIDHPQRVDKLVLVDSAGMSALSDALGPRVRRALRLSSVEDFRLLAPLTFYDARYHDPNTSYESAFASHLAAGDSFTVGRIIDSLERGEDTVDEHLTQIDRPTLIVWGGQDALIPLRFGEYLKNAIPSARLVTLDHCGHEPQLECPEIFEQTLAEFLTTKSRPSAKP